jgi:GTP-binding protein
VYLEATRDKSSLLDFKYRPKYEADRGEHGKGKDMEGRGGADLVISVPTGTVVFELESGECLVDLVQHGQRVLMAKGGRGGRGNMSFATSTNRAPRHAEPGELGQSKVFRLELRLLADVGLVGLPNAGKSSFLRAVSRAEPKIADYPFTTLEPSLGVAAHKGQTLVIADLPGLIEGASEGAGLGYKFLKHVSRNRMLLHLVESDPPAVEIMERLRIIRQELKTYDPGLESIEQWLVFTKSDLLSIGDLETKKYELNTLGYQGYFISSHTGAGIVPLLDALAERKHSWVQPPLDSEEDSDKVSGLGV